ncbi:Fe(3+) ABC transporter substrate-binding protein [Aquicoccus sp. G2-2]|uniref:Fe(3+) ABC transporter substrate-binding protein n=1 Tax=Aquicoccus sp. G2-2 TaxID=3092120 RepID=UPI002ADFE005|nr:Fe(3+) ABC transporter substrate-binding protein [Aquicoccus sp. G2-2]MEA1112836.1 Fe(3+) ABC transporter substrate-binding protein [Aquicoccus sp. G2-2]
MLPRLALIAALATAGSAASATEEVNLYSYRLPELLKPLTDAFTEESGIRVNVAHMSSGMVERLVAEGDRSPADLVFTVDIARMAAVVDAGVIQPVTSKALEAHVPPAYHDPDGLWWAMTTRARVVYASKERVKDGEVTTYEDLVNPKWKGRLCTRSGMHPYNISLTAAYLFHHGEAATKAWLEGLKANLARKPQGGDTQQVKAIWAGECDIALGNTYYMGKILADPDERAWGESTRIIFPVFEGGGTHVNISGVAMTKAAPHPANALKLMEFLASPKAQQIYAEANYEYPVAPGVAPDKVVASWGAFTPDTANLSDLARLRPDAVKLMEEVDFDG